MQNYGFLDILKNKDRLISALYAGGPFGHGKPSADQINLMKKTYPEACEANMKYTKLRTSAQPKWGATSDSATIDQVGKLQPDFMMAKDLEHFNKKYCEKYPSSEMAKRRAEAKEAKEKYDK